MRSGRTFLLACAVTMTALGACSDDTSDGGGSGGETSGAGGQGGEGGFVLSGKPLKIMNWNTRNFLNDVNDSSAPEEQLNGNYEGQLEAVAATIETMNPDVV